MFAHSLEGTREAVAGTLKVMWLDAARGTCRDAGLSLQSGES